MAGRLTRFLNLEKRRPAREEPRHGVVTPGRFKPQDELQLSPDHGEQPFLRCPSCEADNGRFAVRCLNCSARLDTAEVHAFNDALWKQRMDALETARAAAEQQKADQRVLGETIAQEVAEREQARLGGPATPPGMRWLASLEEEQRGPAALGALAVFSICALVAVVATGHPWVRMLAGALALVLLSLFLPSRFKD